ncbi:hypothetical protein COCMIDRAFT_90454 [Bipolaris oryzae ATCC 44560]|uniref:Uncharacterized protein n=1 Tax=Bipolaris oryzae ATCC 44560 TaxID=930090 RepID=W6ZBH5_COCMI|nr:uncharacterized protein COCMIDRAFT_90454 [Bipolaris oryzae ATCC 44560]EUC47310.1 hypothetical protein COCMIDRAFT_90454 [Bipolaris oryzae ATCC 44560]
MGNSISNMLKEADKEKEAAAIQELEMLQKMIDAVLDKYEGEITEKFLNADNTAKTEVPGIRALRKKRFSTCKVSDKLCYEVNDAIDKFFGAATGGNTKVKLVGGFKAVVNAALNQFLGNTEIGVTDTKEYFIYMHHNAIIRIDLRMWRWNFHSDGFKKVEKGVLGYVFCVSVVDIGALKTAEFVYLISEYAGDEEGEVQQYYDQMGKIYDAARKMQQSEKATITAK